ncbi:hypothetical protein BHE90_016660 [Fusarium euwallaceae]|uniref:Uncharacterized protein n=2 Tax=Fusarium solani species complex TaxID=232080 RepID=A0A430KZT1_9HYPO|nr:hypothetical protein CEP51_015542 [Fusarium floridanum]RTE68962.1 hypothetical protein BHE90_016660 [Fusarium euwallaceae]
MISRTCASSSLARPSKVGSYRDCPLTATGWLVTDCKSERSLCPPGPSVSARNLEPAMPITGRGGPLFERMECVCERE